MALSFTGMRLSGPCCSAVLTNFGAQRRFHTEFSPPQVSRHAYVGAYTGFKPGQLGWVGSKNPGTGISIFQFDDVNGKLQPTGHVVAQECPSWLEVDPSGKFLVATHELSHHIGSPRGRGFISSYRINHASGELTRICTQSTQGRGNTCATFDRTGKFLMVTRYWDNGISLLPFSEDGTIGAVCAAPQHEGAGPHPLRQSEPHPHGVHGDPVTNLVYAMDLGTDKVVQYRLDTTSGTLSLVSEVGMGSETGPRGIVFHPFKRIAYVNCELGGVMVVCNIDDRHGLEPVQTIKAYPDDFVCEGHPENLGKASFWTAEAQITKDAAFLYCICRVHQSVAIFKVAEDGSLLFHGRQSLAKNSNARNMSIDVSGRFLLVASQDADQVECFSIDAANGSLLRTDSQFAPCAADVAVV